MTNKIILCMWHTYAEYIINYKLFIYSIDFWKNRKWFIVSATKYHIVILTLYIVTTLFVLDVVIYKF